MITELNAQPKVAETEPLSGTEALDAFLVKARLPETVGVAARVVEVLTRRIGQHPLSISHIAEELNFSKRTLQRRLQKQEVSFAELRDQVRFHYSIDYLIRQHMSIDNISASLDFSDRTSFTNAFKRWTNLSPSTFRKLFRDYV
ncbi:MAG: AraC family transcriptional regulator [Agarilytica sp.]